MVDTVSYKIDDKDLKADIFLELVQEVWPGTYMEEFANEALKTTINITAWMNSRLVGCVRILTDGYFFGTITEILVTPKYQGIGIGKRLMELAWEVSPTSLFIGSQPENDVFFERIGFERSIQSYEKRKPRKT